MAKWHFVFDIDGKYLERAKLAVHALPTIGPTVCTPIVQRGKPGRAGGETSLDVVIAALRDGPRSNKELRLALKAANYSDAGGPIYKLVADKIIKKDKQGMYFLVQSKKGGR